MFVRNGRVTGSVHKAGLVAADAEPQAEAAPSEPEQRPDGVHAVGGGWHELVVGGKVIDKIRGAEAAQAAYDTYQESEPDEEDEI